MTTPRKCYFVVAYAVAILTFIPGILTMTSGCKTATPAPGGVYSNDTFLFWADTTIDTSYKVAHAFVSWEYAQRANLHNPAITAAADKVRAGAPVWFGDAAVARNDYIQSRALLTNIVQFNSSSNAFKAKVVSLGWMATNSQSIVSTSGIANAPNLFAQ